MHNAARQHLPRILRQLTNEAGPILASTTPMAFGGRCETTLEPPTPSFRRRRTPCRTRRASTCRSDTTSGTLRPSTCRSNTTSGTLRPSTCRLDTATRDPMASDSRCGTTSEPSTPFPSLASTSSVRAIFRRTARNCPTSRARPLDLTRRICATAKHPLHGVQPVLFATDVATALDLIPQSLAG